MRLLLFTFLALAGCTHHKPAEPQPSSMTEKLREKYDQWQAELAASADKNTGWASLVDCDGTLWTGEAVASGHTGQLVLAEWKPGEIHRRPKAPEGECYPDESAATVSADMLTGYMLGMYTTHDLQALQRLQAYGDEKHWFMGEPKELTFLSPEGAGLLARAVAKLGGDSRDSIPEACLTVFKDYEYHIQTLAIWMDGDVRGSVSDICLERLKANAFKFPDDAVIQAVAAVYTGVTDRAIALLLNDTYECPSYVRPVEAYCTVHRAFAAKVILNRYGNQ